MLAWATQCPRPRRDAEVAAAQGKLGQLQARLVSCHPLRTRLVRGEERAAAVRRKTDKARAAAEAAEAEAQAASARLRAAEAPRGGLMRGAASMHGPARRNPLPPEAADPPAAGTPADLERLDRFVAGLWSEPVAEPLSEAWLRPLRALRPMLQPRQLMPEIVCDAARRAGSRNAAGADGSAYAHVAAWPDELLADFCACLALAERMGCWPPPSGPI